MGQYQENFQRESLTGKLLAEIRDKAVMEPSPEEEFNDPGLSVMQSEGCQLVFISCLQG